MYVTDIWTPREARRVSDSLKLSYKGVVNYPVLFSGGTANSLNP